MKKISILVITLISLYIAPIQALELKAYKGKSTLNLELKDLNGQTHKLADYKNKVVMVQFWGTYCPPCRVEMPSMNRLERKMGSDVFKILAVNMGEPIKQIQQFVDEVKPKFTILLDPTGKVITNWNVYVAPSTFIIDTKGKIRYTLFGGIEWDSEEVIDALKNLLAEK